MAAPGERRTTPISRTAATTAAIGLERGCTRFPTPTSPRNVAGTNVETASQVAEAATTAHTKESAGLIGRR